MSKISVLVDLEARPGMALTEMQNVATKMAAVWADTGLYPNPATLFFTGDGLFNPYARMRASLYRTPPAIYRITKGWEIGMSDPSPDMDMVGLSYAAQVAMLNDVKNRVAAIRNCTEPLAEVKSYMPQGTIDEATGQALNAIGIQNVAGPIGGFHTVIPNCFTVAEATEMIAAGVDEIILRLDMASLPMPGGYAEKDYVGLKAMVVAAKAAGYEFVTVDGF